MSIHMVGDSDEPVGLCLEKIYVISYAFKVSDMPRKANYQTKVSSTADD